MIRAHRIDGFTNVFGAYLHALVRRTFRGVWIDPALRFPAGGFIAAPNHASWWDGFIPFLVQRAVAPQIPFYVMMSDAELRRFPFFRWGGAFSVDTHSLRAPAEATLYAASLAREGGGVWIFPQGALQPSGIELRFTSGFVHAARHARVPIVPVAMEFGMLGARQPDAFLTAAPAIEAARRDARDAVQTAVSGMREMLQKQMRVGTALDGRRSIVQPMRGIDDVAAGFSRLLGGGTT